jgi:hypothetical protein
MREDTEVLLFFCGQYWEEIRHTEKQRETLTNLIILIAAAVIGLVGQKGLSRDFILLALLLVVLGLYGVAMTLKLYERYRFLQTRLYYWYDHIDSLHPDAKFLSLKTEADEEHKKQFPRLLKLRVHYLWLALHLLISVSGTILFVMIICKK